MGGMGMGGVTDEQRRARAERDAAAKAEGRQMGMGGVVADRDDGANGEGGPVGMGGAPAGGAGVSDGKQRGGVFGTMGDMWREAPAGAKVAAAVFAVGAVLKLLKVW